MVPLVKFTAAGVAAASLVGTLVALGAHHDARGTHKKGVGVTNVSVAVARKGSVSSTLVLSGLVQAHGMLNVAPSIAGRVGSLLVTAGQRVQAGQVIATLSDQVAQAQLAQAQAAVTAAQAKASAASQGPTPQAVAVAQAAVAKATGALHAAQTQYQAAQAVYQDRVPEQQAVVSAQNQVNQSEAALKGAQASVAAASVKLQQAEAAVQTSSGDGLATTVTADQKALAAAQAQASNDQATLQTDQGALQTAQATLATDQKLYGALASQYSADEQAYQQAVLDYNSWHGYGSNPYTAVVNQTQAAAGPATQAYNTLQTDTAAVQSAEAAIATDKKTLMTDQADIASAQAALQNAQSNVAQQQANNPLSVQAAQVGLQQAQAQEGQAATTLKDAEASLSQTEADYADRTSANQTLLQFKNAVGAAQATLQQAQAGLAATEASPSAATEAAAQSGVAQAQAAENVLQAELHRNTVVAPFSGIITAVPAVVGSLVSPGSPVASIETTQLQIQAVLSQQNLPLVNPGDAVTVNVPGAPEPLPAKVAEISPMGNTTSLTFAVNVVPRVTPGWLKAGEFASLTVLTHTYTQAVIIPESAIVSINGHPQVFVVGSDRTTTLTSITTVLANGTDAMVSGLPAGSRVVVAGQTYLTSGAKVRVTQTVTTPAQFDGSAIGGLATNSAAAPAATATAKGAKK